MMSREEKNKVFVDEIKKEKTIKISKIILKVFLIIFFIFSSLFAYIYFIGPKGLITKEIVIRDTNLPESFSGVKILQISDILYGSTISEDEIKNLEKEIKLINPDIIIFTGNIFYNEYTPNENDITLLNSFFKSIPYTIGKYAILGNFDKNNFNLIMENTNFTILNNETIKVYNYNNDFINLIGISNDNMINNQTNSYTITLINNFDQYEKYQLSSNLVFAGNNLGGEIRIGNLSLLGDNKYKDSYYKINDTKVYISTGLGSPHHMRLFNHPSINVYRLLNS